jgi:hypothetical protein
MKLSTAITTAALTVALIVPTAASARIAPDPAEPAKSKASSHISSVSMKKKPTKKPGTTTLSHKSGKGGKTTKRGSGRILIWIKTGPPVQMQSSVDVCQTSGIDCTPEQECEIWGSNCDAVVRAAQAQQVADSTPDSSVEVSTVIESASSDSSASESSPAESAVTDVSDVGGVDSANLIESWDS